MPPEGIDLFHRSLLRENCNGSMQFVETQERNSTSPRELSFVRYISGRKISENRLTDELMFDDVLSRGVPTRFAWLVPSPR